VEWLEEVASFQAGAAMAMVGDDEVTRFLAAWFEIRQYIQAANFNHFHQAGLSATQFMILNLLPADGASVSIGELARRMNLKPATVAKTVDTLEDRRMLTRGKSADDRRLVLLRITDDGMKLQNAAAGHFRDQIREVFQAIPDSDRAALLQGLESFVHAASSTGRIIREERDAAPAERSSQESPRR
jgi:DNA-binding MarR family transcriptional regulator